MIDPLRIQVWTQFFFDDGSVSQGLRVSADIYDDHRILNEVIEKLLRSVNRTEGFLVIWGAGEIQFGRYSISSSEESDSSASESSQASDLEHS
jgi:hypothetical protein